MASVGNRAGQQVSPQSLGGAIRVFLFAIVITAVYLVIMNWKVFGTAIPRFLTH